MNGTYIAFLPIFMALLILYIERRNNDVATARAIQRKKQKGNTEMLELAKNFLNKKCIVYTLGSNQIDGVIKEVSGGAILLERCDSAEAINLDFVIRIREYPKKKNGKEKSIIAN